MLVILIHNIYHMGFFVGEISTVISSYLLFEMPLFFLISGIGNSMGRKKGLTEFYSKRFWRLLIPYWVYAIICFLLNLLLVWKNSEPPLQILVYLIKWILPLDIQPSTLPFLTLSLWFLPMYLGMIMIFPILRWFAEGGKARRIIPLLVMPISILLLLSVNPVGRYVIKLWNYSEKILFYSFFSYIGCLYQTCAKERVAKNQETKVYTERDRWCTIAVLGAAFMAMMISILCFGASPNMQLNKWPPNLTFMFFALMMLSLIRLSYRKMMKGIAIISRAAFLDWIFRQYEKYFFTICLYHSFTIYAASIVIGRLRLAGFLGDILPAWLLPLTFMFTIIGSALFAFCLGKIEKIRISFR